MADAKISELTTATSADAADLLPIVQVGATKHIEKGDFLAEYAETTYVDGAVAAALADLPIFSPRDLALTTPGVTLTAAGTINTYGAWTELIASTSADFDGLIVSTSVIGANGVATAAVLSLGTGAAASEVEIMAYAVGGHAMGTVGRNIYYIPIRIPSGTRLSGRFQCETISRTGVVHIGGVGTSHPASATSVDVLGLNLGTSRGTAIAVSNTYAEIVASTSRDYRALVVVPCTRGSSGNADTVTYTVGIGGSGAELDIGSVVVTSTTTEQIAISPTTYGTLITQHIPAGTRIACKQSTGAAFREVNLIGIPYA